MWEFCLSDRGRKVGASVYYEHISSLFSWFHNQSMLYHRIFLYFTNWKQLHFACVCVCIYRGIYFIKSQIVKKLQCLRLEIVWMFFLGNNSCLNVAYYVVHFWGKHAVLALSVFPSVTQFVELVKYILLSALKFNRIAFIKKKKPEECNILPLSKRRTQVFCMLWS